TGRGPRGGKVFVQTFSPEHPSIALAAVHDYLGFAAAELATRRQHQYPPYQRLARLVIRSKDREAAGQFAERLAAAFGPAMEGAQRDSAEVVELRILGPAEAPVFRLKGYYRFHFQLQSPSSAFLHKVLRAVVPTVRLPREVDLTIDIDPQDMV